MKRFTVLAIALLGIYSLFANVRLPWIISDNMVIQREIPVKIWGWAEKGEKVTVTFEKQKQTATADASGSWKITLQPLTAGGPFILNIKGKNEIIVKNVLVGDVWVCGGQSNMEWSLSKSRNWDKDKLALDNASIRLFYVPKKISEKPLENTDSAVWARCDIKSAEDFSAIGYYFGKSLQQQYGIPIGLINSNWGGTDIETWTSLETMYSDPDYKSKVENMKGVDMAKLRSDAEKKYIQWQDAVKNSDPGMLNKWYTPEFDASGWKEMKIPQLWEGAGYSNLDGVVWFRKNVILTADEVKQSANISLGPIDDSEETYINGVKIGATYDQYSKSRYYVIPAGVLKTGDNVICIKVIDTGGGGGLWANDEQMFLEIGANRRTLAGNWKFNIALDLPAPQNAMSPNGFPSLLYNGMINPLTNFGIKGVIWYQGENNSGNYLKYRTLFTSMITDWRTKWQQGDFAFLFVQLANYMDPAENPKESSWAGLREAQTMALKLPKTGMAVIIDIGEAKDIHPKNKDDVGKRLALAARKVAYGENIVYSGPMYQAMKIDSNKIVIDFSNIGSGLKAVDKYGYLKGFTIAGEDKKFVWAEARITSDNKVIVSSSLVTNPVAVRYAWADNPDDTNLYNQEMLPASPFRTDNW